MSKNTTSETNISGFCTNAKSFSTVFLPNGDNRDKRPNCSWRLSQYIMASFDDFEAKFSKIIPSNLISLTKFPFLFVSSSFISRQRRSEIICKLNWRDNSCKSECHLSNNQVRKKTQTKKFLLPGEYSTAQVSSSHFLLNMSAKFRIAVAIYFGYAGVVMLGALDARNRWTEFEFYSRSLHSLPLKYFRKRYEDTSSATG